MPGIPSTLNAAAQKIDDGLSHSGNADMFKFLRQELAAAPECHCDIDNMPEHTKATVDAGKGKSWSPSNHQPDLNLLFSWSKTWTK